MTRWLRTHFWMATGISTATLLCVGVWPVITPTEAREKSKPEVARAQKANGNSGSSRTATQGQTAKKGSNSKPADPLKSELNPAAKNNELDVAAIPYEQPEAKVTTNVVTATGTSVQTATASGGGANGAFNGVININGKEVRTNDPAEFQKMLQQNGGLFPQLPLGANGGAAAAGGGANGGAAAGGGANGAFNGVININGKEVRTNDPAEFQKMLQQNGGLFPQLPQGANGGAAAAGGGANGGAAAGGATSKSTQRNINGKSTSSGSSKSSAKGRQGAKGNQPKAN